MVARKVDFAWLAAFGFGAFALGFGQAPSRPHPGVGLLLLALLQQRDVAEHSEDAAVRERLVGEFDEASARRLPLVAGTAGRTHEGGPALYHFLDIIGRSEVAALGLITDHVVARTCPAALSRAAHAGTC
jgi:hypothetical protein